MNTFIDEKEALLEQVRTIGVERIGEARGGKQFGVSTSCRGGLRRSKWMGMGGNR